MRKYYESSGQPTRNTPPRDTHEWRGVTANGSKGQTSILRRVLICMCVFVFCIIYFIYNNNML